LVPRPIVAGNLGGRVSLEKEKKTILNAKCMGWGAGMGSSNSKTKRRRFTVGWVRIGPSSVMKKPSEGTSPDQILTGAFH